MTQPSLALTVLEPGCRRRVRRLRPSLLGFGRPLVRGTLVRRYKRFLADVRLAGGRCVTAHCPNTGSLLGLARPGSVVLLSDTGRSSSRRLRYTWEAVRSGRGWVAVNTARANQVAALALRNGLIAKLAGYTDVRAEVPVSPRSRIDFSLAATGRPAAYVEVKSVTLREGRAALFPDAVTERGRRHLEELEHLACRGRRAVLLLLVMRADCDAFAPADAIDPAYGRTLRRVAQRGVEILAYTVRVTARGLRLEDPLPVRLD